MLCTGLAWLPAWLVPSTVFNPVDTSDVADYLAKCGFDGRRGMRAEIGGPEDLSLVEFARQYQQGARRESNDLAAAAAGYDRLPNGVCREQRRARNSFMVGAAGATAR